MSAAGMHEEQAQIKHEEEDEDAHEPDPEPTPEEEEEEQQEEEGGDDEGALEEESLPSTLFYGVRGQQARLRPSMQCSPGLDPLRSAVQCKPMVEQLLGGILL